ncbi:hypothetical protein ACH5RR_041580 [Cinchona calisaya]|uniref:BHLH domain-containing protein n=1 Tax=Cinchona calisaya TaxID=153742 RepID=A0ABD2XV65_9GENT
METGLQNNEDGGVLLENLRMQLALAVKSIQWSYAIFWSISSKQPGVLEWVEGYYNGDIKTRKTVQSAEVNDADKLGLQRSEQLRELYESLSAAADHQTNTNPQANNKRPSVALSPEDLTDTEWYFLGCMSFVFNIGQGLPGRTLAKNQITWLCNAHQADSKIFTRSLLAKSATIQTVVCFPYLGGVVELGVTDHVTEDRNLIQHIKSTFLDNPCPLISKIPNYVAYEHDKDIIFREILDENMTETDLDPLDDFEEGKTCSPNINITGFEAEDQLADEISSRMDDEISNCVHNSMNSSDCISQTYANPEEKGVPLDCILENHLDNHLEKGVPLSNEERVKNDYLNDFQECNQKQLGNFNFRGDDVHYQGALSALLKSSHQLILGPYFGNNNQESSFVRWKKGRSQVLDQTAGGASAMPQNLLKKVLFGFARLHCHGELESSKGCGKREKIWSPEADEFDNNHVLAERKRRERLNERFMMLGSLVPSNGKVDKVSILYHTIDYLKELERRVEELESCKEATEVEAGTRGRHQEAIERSSDNYFNDKVGKSRKQLIRKRKASDVEEIEPKTDRRMFRESLIDDVSVNVIDKNALIVVKCPWTESVFLEIMEAVSKFNLDSHTVQSSKADGSLSLSIKAKPEKDKMQAWHLFFLPSMCQEAKDVQEEENINQHEIFTTIEALGAYIWRSRYRALRQNPDGITIILLAMGIRNFIKPPLPQGYYGNAFLTANVELLGRDLEDGPLSKVAKQEKNDVPADDQDNMGDYVSILLSDWRRLILLEEDDFGWKSCINFVPISWSNYGYYDLCVFTNPPRNDTKMKGGVRIYLSLPAAAMQRFNQEMDARKIMDLS